MFKKLFLLMILGTFVSLHVPAFSEPDLRGTWEVSSLFSSMALTLYSFEEEGEGVMEIVLNAGTEAEETAYHPFIYEIRDDILFITLIDPSSRQPLMDKQSGKTLIDKYRIIFIEENDALLQTADRDVILIKQ